MQFFTVAAAIVGLASAAPAATYPAGGYAIVQNNCNFPAYVQSVPYNGAPAGKLTTVPPKGSYSEPYYQSGSTVKMGTQPALAAPLFFGYSLSSSPNLAYYELSNQYGNPFAGYKNTLITSRQPCPQVSCAANNASCYSNKGSHVNACGRPTNITATLCSA